MFENVGEKLKVFAEVLFWLGTGFFIIYGFYAAFVNENSFGIIVAIVGEIGLWLSSLLMGGFGELIENSSKTNKWLEELVQWNRIRNARKKKVEMLKKNTFRQNVGDNTGYNANVTEDILARMKQNEIAELEKMLEENEISQDEFDQLKELLLKS